MTGLAILTPTYGGKVDTPYYRSMLTLAQDLTSMGIEHDVLTMTNESLIHRGRMNMAHKFLTGSDFSAALFIDSDIEFTSEHVAKVWNHYFEGKHQIVTGVYPMKKPDKAWYAAWKDGKLIKDLDQFKGKLTPVDFAGTGFLLISRYAFARVRSYLEKREKMARELLAKIPEQDAESEAIIGEMRDMMAAKWESADETMVDSFFMTPIYNGSLESEDYHFCRIARQAGLQVMLDPTVKLIHWGQWGYGLPRDATVG